MKKVVRKLRIQDEKSDFLYWQSQPPLKRIEALEKIRTEYISWKYVIQLGYPPNRIDILTQVTGLEFDLCYSSKMELDVDGIIVNFLDLERV